MLEKLVEGTGYYQFPSFEVAIYSVLLALVLSSSIALTYRLTFTGSSFPNGFFQAMILSAIATSTIMMAVGNNLAVGFSIIGVIAIIRFRIQFQNSRNIIFIFAAISAGVATGAYGYAIAVAGTLIFCLVAFTLHYSSFALKPTVKHQVDFVIADGGSFQEALATLNQFVKEQSLTEIRTRGNGARYEYQCEIKPGVEWNEIYAAMIGKTIEVRIQEVKREEVL